MNGCQAWWFSREEIRSLKAAVELLTADRSKRSKRLKKLKKAVSKLSAAEAFWN